MGSYARNSKGLREVTTVMEKVVETAASGKKRKLGLEEASNLSTSSVQLKKRRLTVMTPVNSTSPMNSGDSTCESVSSDNVLASCCSSNGSSEVEKIQDEDRLELFPTSIGDSLDCRERSEITPSSEVQAESDQLESTTRPHESVSRRRFMAEKMPSEVELEEFFAAAEKNLQKKFIDKYNYDIVKDEPLEGRFDWVQIQRKP